MSTTETMCLKTWRQAVSEKQPSDSDLLADLIFLSIVGALLAGLAYLLPEIIL